MRKYVDLQLEERSSAVDVGKVATRGTAPSLLQAAVWTGCRSACGDTLYVFCLRDRPGVDAGMLPWCTWHCATRSTTTCMSGPSKSVWRVWHPESLRFIDLSIYPISFLEYNTLQCAIQMGDKKIKKSKNLKNPEKSKNRKIDFIFYFPVFPLKL